MTRLQKQRLLQVLDAERQRQEAASAKPLSDYTIETLTTLYNRMPAELQRDFWQLDGSQETKIMYLYATGQRRLTA